MGPPLMWRMSARYFHDNYNLLRKLKTQLPDSYLLVVYHTLFHAHIRYGVLLWEHSSSCTSVLQLLNRAVRLIVSGGPKDHFRPFFTELQTLTFHTWEVSVAYCETVQR